MVWAIDVQEPAHVVDDFLDGLGGVDFPVLLDLDGAVFEKYDYRGAGAYAPFPRQYIVDRDGIVVYQANQYYPEAVEEALSVLFP